MTSQVILESPNGKQLLTRALLDPGASISPVAKRVVQQLQLQKHSHQLSITGAQGVSTRSISHSVTFAIQAVNAVQPVLSLTAAVVPKVTCDLPLQGAAGVRLTRISRIYLWPISTLTSLAESTCSSAATYYKIS